MSIWSEYMQQNENAASKRELFKELNIRKLHWFSTFPSEFWISLLKTSLLSLSLSHHQDFRLSLAPHLPHIV